MKKLLPTTILCLSMLVACAKDDTTQDQTNGAGNEPQQTGEQTGQQTAEMVVHDVKCGCSIDGVGKCGNYVMVDGKYVPLIHPKLGVMEFCKFKDAGAKIETVGELKDGKFVAESWKLIQ